MDGKWIDHSALKPGMVTIYNRRIMIVKQNASGSSAAVLFDDNTGIERCPGLRVWED